MPFSNPIVGGNKLILPAIQSPIYAVGTTGWTVNRDGSAEFNNVIIRGTVVVGNGTTNTIILDEAHDAMFIYDGAGNLVLSSASVGGTDSFGNVYQAGWTNYTAGNLALYTQLFNDGIAFSVTGTTPTGGGLQTFSALSNADTSELIIVGPSNSTKAAWIRLKGQSNDTTVPPRIVLGTTNGDPIDITVNGGVKFQDTAGNIEAPHPILPQTNWGALGAPWGDPKYYRSGINTIKFTGAIQWNTVATAAPVLMFTLPAGYRPNRQLHIEVPEMPAPGAFPRMMALEIATNGNVSLTNYTAGGPFTPISLENVEFALVG